MNTIAERIKFAMNVRNVKASGNGYREQELQRERLVLIFLEITILKKDKLELIADALDININWLMGENVPMENSNATDNQTTGYVFYKRNGIFIER